MADARSLGELSLRDPEFLPARGNELGDRRREARTGGFVVGIGAVSDRNDGLSSGCCRWRPSLGWAVSCSSKPGRFGVDPETVFAEYRAVERQGGKEGREGD